MKYMNYLEKTRIPALGLGTWKSGKGEVYSAVRQAIRLGYRHIDCAPAYENEVEVGTALSEIVDSGSVARNELWLTSKLWNNAHLPEDVEPALKRTLSDLQLDYLDLYLIHWPVAFIAEVFFPRSQADFLSLEQAPIIETWQAMEECVKKGLIKHIGVCNFSIKKLENLLQGATIAPMMNQVELHPYLQQNELLSYCQEKEILMTAFSPLGSADRPDRLKKTGEPALLTHPTITGIAKEHKATPAQVLLNWTLQRDTVVIPKSVNPARLKENFAAQEISLSSEEMAAIAAMDTGYRYVDGSFWDAPESGYFPAAIWDDEG